MVPAKNMGNSTIIVIIIMAKVKNYHKTTTNRESP
jgi:hypothetical protein